MRVLNQKVVAPQYRLRTNQKSSSKSRDPIYSQGISSTSTLSILIYILSFPFTNCILKSTNLSITASQPFTNSSSVNLLADSLARFRIANLSFSDKACSKAAANSSSVVAWNPVSLISTQLLPKNSTQLRISNRGEEGKGKHTSRLPIDLRDNITLRPTTIMNY